MVAANTIGEKEIEKILKQHAIKYTRKKKLTLKKDSRKFRIPDFYIADKKLAIEYFGSWNITDNKELEKRERKRFMEKVGAYNTNGINCVYIYPSELVQAENIILNAVKEASPTKKGEKPLLWVIPWLEQDKIEEPLPSDFIEKPLNWKISWLDQEKIEKPKSTDFVTTTTTETITTTPAKKEHTVIIGKNIGEEKDIPKIKYKYKEGFSTLAKIILFLAGLNILLLISFILTYFFLGLFDLNEMLFEGVIVVTTILVILSAIYSIQKEIFIGFVIVGIIIFILLLFGLALFGNIFQKVIFTIILTIAILPIIYYMINYNEKM
jgi:hypothetical protein